MQPCSLIGPDGLCVRACSLARGMQLRRETLFRSGVGAAESCALERDVVLAAGNIKRVR